MDIKLQRMNLYWSPNFLRVPLILWENFNVIVLIFKSVYVELKEDVVLIKINHELLTNETFFLTSAGIIELN